MQGDDRLYIPHEYWMGIPVIHVDTYSYESENCKLQMYRVDAKHPGQSLYTCTTVCMIRVLVHELVQPKMFLKPFIMYVSL